MTRLRLVALVLATVFGFVAPQARATQPCQRKPYPSIWVPDGTRVTTPSAALTHAVVLPGSGDAVRVYWTDLRDPAKSTTYLRRIGRESWHWSSEHRIGFAPGNETSPMLTSAPEQSLLAVWSDDRSDAGDIYVQRTGAWGGGIWPSFVLEGIAVCRAAGRQSRPSVAVDGQGGFFVAWVDERLGATSGMDIYIQRFYDYGLVWDGWPVDGIPLCRLPGDQVDPVVVCDGDGNALVFFRDDAEPLDSNLRMARITGGATRPAGWLDGKPMTLAPADVGAWNVQPEPGGGAWVAWEEVTVPGVDPASGIRLARVTADGLAAGGWSLEGVSLAAVDGVDGAPTMAADGAGGLFVGWVEAPTLGTTVAKVSRVGADGAPMPGWPGGGRGLGPALSSRTSVALLADQGTVIAAWTDPEGGGDIRASRLDIEGRDANFWPAGGLVLSAALGTQQIDAVRSGEPAFGPIASDGYDGALVFWNDERDGTPAVYGQHVSRNGVLDPLVWEGVPCDKSGWVLRAYPVPARDAVTVELYAPRDRGLRFKLYDVRGRLRADVRAGSAPGPAVISRQLDVSRLEPGVYFVRYELEGGGGVSRGSRRIVIAR